MTRTTRLRRIILHFAHIFLTDARTFIVIASETRAHEYTRSRTEIIPDASRAHATHRGDAPAV